MQDHPPHRGQTVRPLRTRVPLRTLLLLIGMGLTQYSHTAFSRL